MWRRHRDLIEQDLHETYGIDVDLGNPYRDRTLRRRSWSWFLVRLGGLLNSNTRLATAMTPDEPTGAARVPEHR